MFDWRKSYLIYGGAMLVCAGCILTASANGRVVSLGKLIVGSGRLSNLRPKADLAKSGLLGATRPLRPFKPSIGVDAQAGISPTSPGILAESFEVAQLSVAIFPLNARSAGARWRLLGVTQFKQSDETVTVNPGIYRLQLSEIPGMETPKPRSLRLIAGKKLKLDAVYGTSVPIIATTKLEVAAVGESYAARINVLNLPTSVTASGLEGTGLEFDTVAKVIRGTPVVTGSFPVRVTATNTGGSDERDFTLEVRNTVTFEVSFNPTLGRISFPPSDGWIPISPFTRRVPVGTFQEAAAKPRRGAVFGGWKGTGVDGLPTVSPTLTFVITGDVSVTADFIPNPFPTLTGQYEGLLVPTVGSAENSGSARVRVSRAGAFTANLAIGGKRHALMGSFAGDGSAGGKLKIRDTSVELAARFNLDVTGTADQIAILLEGPETRIEGVADQVD